MIKMEKNKLKLGNVTMVTIFWIFYYSTLFVSVWYILQFNWGEISTIKLVENMGILGGLMFLGEFFKKETKSFSGNKKESQS